jgi:hypothetical protein
MKLKHIHLYEQFINEDGYGRDYFVKKKDGKILKYFFKIEGEEEVLGFLLSIGKTSKETSIEGAENSYCVLSVEPMSVNVMDDYLVNETDYKSRDEETFKISKSEFLRFYEIVGECLKDYLKNSPKVTTVYDDLTLNIDMSLESYSSRVKNMMDTWSYGRWSSQTASSNKTLVYLKRDHD